MYFNPRDLTKTGELLPLSRFRHGFVEFVYATYDFPFVRLFSRTAACGSG
ncbi:MAG: hypothetical protein ACE5HE_02850 [Phycisphaerae bacterium]